MGVGRDESLFGFLYFISIGASYISVALTGHMNVL